MLIAIKGLIGSGKTTTSTYLHENYGVYHYNCDQRVKSIYKTHQDVIQKVNNQVLDVEAENIDMDMLRNVAFSDRNKLLKLEEIVYPYLQAEIDFLSEEYQIILLDCQQVDKMGLDIDINLYLNLEEQLLIKRVEARDGRSKAQIEDILKIQKQYQVNSDYIVENNGSLKELYAKLDNVMEEINEKANR